jgi:hypothetical protein
MTPRKLELPTCPYCGGPIRIKMPTNDPDIIEESCRCGASNRVVPQDNEDED